MSDKISNIQSIITDELAALEVKIVDNIDSISPLANQVCQHLTHHPGKRIRPTVLILSALAAGYDTRADDVHLELASIIEYIHNASLLHDDVIDDAATRRGLPAANTIWGNKACILTGDFLHARAFQIATSLGAQVVFEILSDAVTDIIEGELEQLRFNRDYSISKTQYLSIIGAKTARLFSVSCQLGALIGEGSSADLDALTAYGHHLGMAFQLMDDIADYTATTANKACGQDIASGVMTLPLIYAYQHSDDTDKEHLAKLIKNPQTQLADVIPFVERTGAVEKCLQEAMTATKLAEESIAKLKPTTYKDALLKLVRSIVPK